MFGGCDVGMVTMSRDGAFGRMWPNDAFEAQALDEANAYCEQGGELAGILRCDSRTGWFGENVSGEPPRHRTWPFPYKPSPPAEADLARNNTWAYRQKIFQQVLESGHLPV